MYGLFSLRSLEVDKIKEILSLASEFKSGLTVSYSGKRMATLFFENSTRTQYSFQMAMMKLGIDHVAFNKEASSVTKGETLYDTVKTFESIGFDGVVIRHPDNDYYNQLEGINIPIINGGDGSGSHPTQSLLDLMTIKEEFGDFKGLKCCIVGDIVHSRVAHTDADIMRRLGMEVYIAGPENFLDGTAPVLSLDEAVKKCDIIMMLRVQFERAATLNSSREEYFANYGMTMERVNSMKKNAIIMHPAPVNRGVEIADEAVECSRSRIFRQMQNGVYVRMAVISMVLDKKL